VQVVGVAALGVQRIRGDQHVGQIQPIEQPWDHRDLAALARDLALGQHRSAGQVEQCHQVGSAAVGSAGAADGLPVHRQHLA
jgi:hypothetical protein